MEIGQVSERFKIKSHTLRYYESIGLIQNIERDASGKRVYSEKDLVWLDMIMRLRATGMPIEKMKTYARLRYLGDETVTERKIILKEHLENIESEIQKLTEMQIYVTHKIKVYEEMEAKNYDKNK